MAAKGWCDLLRLYSGRSCVRPAAGRKNAKALGQLNQPVEHVSWFMWSNYSQLALPHAYCGPETGPLSSAELEKIGESKPEYVSLLGA